MVKKQVGSSVDLVNDGEMSEPSYATYVKDRLTGFAGSSNTFVYQDLAEFPNLPSCGPVLSAKSQRSITTGVIVPLVKWRLSDDTGR